MDVEPALTPPNLNDPCKSLLLPVSVEATLEPLASSLTVMVTMSPIFEAFMSLKRDPEA